MVKLSLICFFDATLFDKLAAQLAATFPVLIWGLLDLSNTMEIKPHRLEMRRNDFTQAAVSLG
jgi:hypothetical protein